jgi:hypothetical protein
VRGTPCNLELYNKKYIYIQWLEYSEEYTVMTPQSGSGLIFTIQWPVSGPEIGGVGNRRDVPVV